MSFRNFIFNWTPPAILSLVRRSLNFFRPAPWEYLPQGWEAPVTTRGWNLNSIAQTQYKKWNDYAAIIKSTLPLGVNHEDTAIDEKNIIAHNLMMTFCYVISLNSRKIEKPSFLDWGGGIGHYGLLAKEVIADTQYFCYDLPELCEIGRKVLPEGVFFESRTLALSQKYDLVYAGSSLWYDKDWKQTINELCAVTKQYLCVNKMIFVENVPSFVAIQRPRGIYDTEYICWILNKSEFINHINKNGFILVRELLIDKSPFIFRAPEQGNIVGFLFRKLT